jgi:two-component system, sensor histidine kinase YesM
MKDVRFIGSFKFKLIITIVLIILIPMFAFLFTVQSIAKRLIADKYSTILIQSVAETTKNIDFILNNIISYSNVILLDKQFTGLLRSKIKIGQDDFDNLLGGLVVSREDIDSIEVYSSFNLYSFASDKGSLGNDKAWIIKLLGTDGEISWINTEQEKVKIMTGEFDKYDFSLARKIIDLDTLDELGVLRLKISEDVLETAYKNLIKEGTIYSFICDSKGEIISHPDKSKIGAFIGNQSYFKDLMSSKDKFGAIPFLEGKSQMLAVYSTCNVTGWKLIQVIPYDYLFNDIEKLKNVFLVFSIFYIIFSVIIALGLSILLVEPITGLVKKMKEAESGNFDVQIVVNKNDEIGVLGKTFNKMIFEIKSLIQTIKEEEKFKKELELESLHAQINPHFLYNTLNSIKWMAKMQGAKNISSTVTALTKLLRVSISIGNEKITLGEEIEYVKSYILIQKVRFNEQFEVSYSIEENCKKCSIPKLILQPIVEN